MLRIRLKRVGRRNDPSFRIIVVDGRKGPKSNVFVEQLGFYNPKTKEKKIDTERAAYWVGVGAQPSGTVYNMLVDAGVVKGKKRNVLPQKSPVVKEADAADKTEVAEAPAENAEEEQQEEAGETVEEKEEEKEEKDDAEAAVQEKAADE